MKTLVDTILYEKEVLKGMRNANAKIPFIWSVERQEGFVDGMKYAQEIIEAGIKK